MFGGALACDTFLWHFCTLLRGATFCRNFGIPLASAFKTINQTALSIRARNLRFVCYYEIEVRAAFDRPAWGSLHLREAHQRCDNIEVISATAPLPLFGFCQVPASNCCKTWNWRVAVSWENRIRCKTLPRFKLWCMVRWWFSAVDSINRYSTFCDVSLK